MRLIATSLAAVLLAAGTGFTSCNQFHTVTVPSADTTAPWIYNVGYSDLGYEFFQTYRLDSPDDSVIAIGSAMDDGGVRTLEMRWHASASCCANGVCESHSEPYGGTLADQQTGGVGSQVSNGIWVGRNVRPRDFCGAGWTPSYFHFWWTTTATDFLGNGATKLSGDIVYP